MEELIAINVVIADRAYRMKVKQEDEGTIRNTARLINEKIIEFKMAFAGKDLQDYISMVLLWFAIEQSKGSSEMVAESEASKTLVQMDLLLDKALNSN